MAALWPRAAAAGGILAVLVITLWWLNPLDRKWNLASAPAPASPLAAPSFTTNSGLPTVPASTAITSLPAVAVGEPTDNFAPGRTLTSDVALADGSSPSTFVLTAAPIPTEPSATPTPLSLSPSLVKRDSDADSRGVPLRRFGATETSVAPVPQAEARTFGDEPRPQSTRSVESSTGYATSLVTAAQAASPSLQLSRGAFPVESPEYSRTVAAPTQQSTPAAPTAGARPERLATADARRRLNVNGIRADATQILTNFALEQNGPTLRLIDADGSVYEGRILTASAKANEFKDGANERAKATPVRVNSLAKSPIGPPTDGSVQNPSPAALELSFEVSGTNTTLRQPVVLAGTLLFQPGVDPNALAPSRLQFRAVLGQNPIAEAVTSAPSDLGSIQVLRIQGRGHFGATTEFRIDAVPAHR